MYTKVYDARETMFSDQTGQFPKRSQQGNKYIMVLVEIDSNAILVEPMKSRKDAEMIRAYTVLLTRLKRAGIIPKKHILDNEISENMKNIIRDECKIQLELVPPGCHRRNAAEVAIRNFKSHFLSVLAGVADDFPLHLWDRLLPQTEITLNLLRQSNATPTVSAYAHLSGPFDYNKMPLAPMGYGAQVHEKTDKRGTWAYHSVDGWYLYTSPEHYRTHACHIKATRSERLTDTIQFRHKNITNPTISHGDKVMQALADCMKMLKGGDTSTGMQDMDGLKQLVETTQLRMKREPHKTLETDSTSGKQHTLPRVQPVPRVDKEERDDRRTTRSMAQEASKSTPPAPIAEFIQKIAKIRSKKNRRTARAPPPLCPPLRPTIQDPRKRRQPSKQRHQPWELEPEQSEYPNCSNQPKSTARRSYYQS